MHPAAHQYRELVEGLVALKPKKRGNPVSWIVLAGCAYVLGGIGFDASVREAMFSPSTPQRGPTFTAPAPTNARVAMPVIYVPPPQALAPGLVPQGQGQGQVQQAPLAQGGPVVQGLVVQGSPDGTMPDVADDGPLPHAKARKGAPTKRAHSAKRHK